MAEDQERGIRQQRLDFRLKLIEEIRHCINRHAHVKIGIIHYHGHGFSDAVTDCPDGLPFPFGFTDHGIQYPVLLQFTRQGIFENVVAGLITDLGQHVNGIALIKRAAHRRNMFNDVIIVTVPHDLERTQRPAEFPAHEMQEPYHVLERLQRDQRGAAALRFGEQAQYRTRDDAQRAFGADKQVFQVVSGVIFQHLVERVDDGSIRQHHFQPQDEIAGHAEPDHLVAAGIGGDVTADIAGTPGAKIQGKQEPSRIRRILDGLQGSTCKDGHGHGRLVQFLNAAEPFKGERNFFLLWSGAAA